MTPTFKNCLAAASLSLVAACATAATDEVVITEIPVDALPPSVPQAIAAERDGFTIGEVLRKVRDGRTYYDVEGELADGSELEFDILMGADGSAEIVEIQRDLEWADVPPEVRDAALVASDGELPVRIIESVQTDGSVIYELFAEGQPADPAYEVRVHAGEVETLSERWIH